MRNSPDDFTIQPEQIGDAKFLIEPGHGRQFPIETADLVLSRQQIDRLKLGEIDVVIYGRIFYTDLHNRSSIGRNTYYKSLFCFYVMKDASTISTCPNQAPPTHPEEAYTNWAP